MNNYEKTITLNQINITSPTQVCSAIKLNNSLVDNHLRNWRGVYASVRGSATTARMPDPAGQAKSSGPQPIYK